jgi:hypothetical protein
VLANEWRQETVSLSSLATRPDVLIRFKGISDYGNNLFIDEVNIPNTVSVLESSSTLPLRSYPNPVTSDLYVEAELALAQNVQLNVLNALGQVVLTESQQAEAGHQHLQLDASALPAGIYNLQTVLNGRVHLSKFIKK